MFLEPSVCVFFFEFENSKKKIYETRLLAYLFTLLCEQTTERLKKKKKEFKNSKNIFFFQTPISSFLLIQFISIKTNIFINNLLTSFT
jgi:hypothetical protein